MHRHLCCKCFAIVVSNCILIISEDLETTLQNIHLEGQQNISGLLQEVKSLCEIILLKVNRIDNSRAETVKLLDDLKIKQFYRLQNMESLFEFEELIKNDGEAVDQLVSAYHSKYLFCSH